MVDLELLRELGFAATQILLFVSFFCALALGRSHLRPSGWSFVVLGSALLVAQTVVLFGGALVASLLTMDKFQRFHSFTPFIGVLGILGSALTTAGLVMAVRWIKRQDKLENEKQKAPDAN